MKRRAAILVALFAVVGLLAQSITPLALARPHVFILDNLAVYYRLEEASGVRYDEGLGCGGSGCDLSATNTPGNAAGKLGDGVDLEESSAQYLSHSDDDTFDPGDSDFSVAVWVNLESKLVEEHIVSKWSNSAGNRSYALVYSGGDDRFLFAVSSTGGGASYAYGDTFGSPSTGIFYFVVATYDATADSMCISVNAGTADCVAHSGGAFNSTTGFRIGRDDGGGVSTHFDGVIDSVGLWNKELSGDEITALYNSGAGYEFPWDVPTATPTATNTPTATATNAPTDTPTATATPTDTPTATPTTTATATCTALEECTLLSTGNRFAYVRVVTFGDVLIAIIIVALALFAYVTWSHNATRDLFR